tara:strand:- start:7853 stop:8350 length:498 start_codon:yes stop_codon:yes gene_type:complete
MIIDPASLGYDIGVEFIAALLLAFSGGAWAMMRRAHRVRELLAERVLGVVRTISQLAALPLGDEQEEAVRSKYFAEFVASQMEAELSDNMGDMTAKQQMRLKAFKAAVRDFIAARDGPYVRRSKNYWRNYDLVVDAAREALKSMRALGRRSRNELDALRRNELSA